MAEEKIPEIDLYEAKVDQINYKRVSMREYTSNRGMKYAMLKANLWNGLGQAKFGFMYGGSIGFVSGVILGSYSAYKARSPMVMVASGIMSGGFFGC